MTPHRTCQKALIPQRDPCPPPTSVLPQPVSAPRMCHGLPPFAVTAACSIGDLGQHRMVSPAPPPQATRARRCRGRWGGLL